MAVVLVFASLLCFFLQDGVTSQTISLPNPESLNCDFEGKKFCNWSLNTSSDLHWSFRSGPRRSYRDSGPRSDHTRGDGRGVYTYVQYKQPYNQTARLVSPTVRLDQEGMCLKFWYNNYGTDVKRLSIWLVDPAENSGQRLLWSRLGNQGPEWLLAQINVPGSLVGREVTLIIQAENGLWFRDIITIDDVAGQLGACPASADCDFNVDFCDYTVQQPGGGGGGNERGWRVTTNASITNLVDPVSATDHLSDGPKRNYAYFDTFQAGLSSTDRFSLVSPLLEATPASCLSFWYFIKVGNAGLLDVRQDLSVILTLNNKNQEARWRMITVDISSHIDFELRFEVVLGVGDGSIIALDDVRLVPGMCPPAGTCDFESDLCTWVNEEGGEDEPYWTRVRGPQWMFDHTLNMEEGGHLTMYKRKSWVAGDKARLVSPRMEAKTRYCFGFWYFINGEDSATISVTIEASNGMGIVFTLSGDHGPEWKSSTLDIAPRDTEFFIVFIATMVKQNSKLIGIDDLFIDNSTCSESGGHRHEANNGFLCTVSQTYLPLSKVCDFHPDCPDGEEELNCGYTCSFDGGMCGWKNTHLDMGSWWETRLGDENDVKSLVIRDYGGRNYLFPVIEDLKLARLDSPLLQQSAPTCEVRFKLYKGGDSSGYLSVAKVSRAERAVLLTFTTTTNQTWLELTLPLGSNESPFVVSLDYKPGFIPTAIAVDDIRFRNCDFPLKGDSCTGASTFVCDHAACVTPDRTCDFEDNCGDNSDEKISMCMPYFRCDFELDLCGWSNGDNDDMDWTRVNRHETQLRIDQSMPSRDHTLDSRTGHFVYIDNFMAKLPGDRAEAFSPVFTPNGDCWLVFYLHMVGEAALFNVYVETAGSKSRTIVFSREGEMGDFWDRKVIQIYSSEPARVVFEAFAGPREPLPFYKDDKGSIALDDLVLSPGCGLTTGSLTSSLKPATTDHNTSVQSTQTSETVTTASGQHDVTTTPPDVSNTDSVKPTKVSTAGLALSTSSSAPPADVSWQCLDGSGPIHISEKCDFIHHCPVRSDELDCGACTFESSMCGWVDMSRSLYVWDRVNTSYSDVTSLPQYDHTLGASGIGCFLSLRTSDYLFPRFSVLVSPVMGSTSEECQLRFFFISESYQVLDIYLVPSDRGEYEGSLLSKGTRIFTDNLSSSSWRERAVPMESVAAGFKILIRAYNFQTGQGVPLALDDISYTDSCFRDRRVSNQCQGYEYACAFSDVCIDTDDICDVTSNCPRGDDERRCQRYLSCDFEDDFCFFKSESSGNMEWVIQPLTNSSSGTASTHSGSSVAQLRRVNSTTPPPKPTAEFTKPTTTTTTVMPVTTNSPGESTFTVFIDRFVDNFLDDFLTWSLNESSTFFPESANLPLGNPTFEHIKDILRDNLRLAIYNSVNDSFLQHINGVLHSSSESDSNMTEASFNENLCLSLVDSTFKSLNDSTFGSLDGTINDTLSKPFYDKFSESLCTAFNETLVWFRHRSVNGTGMNTMPSTDSLYFNYTTSFSPENFTSVSPENFTTSFSPENITSVSQENFTTSFPPENIISFSPENFTTPSSTRNDSTSTSSAFNFTTTTSSPANFSDLTPSKSNMTTTSSFVNVSTTTTLPKTTPTTPPPPPPRKARLESTIILSPHQADRCRMRFYYRVTGNNTALRVYVQLYNNQPLVLKWSAPPTYRDQWNKTVLVLNDLQAFRVVFEGGLDEESDDYVEIDNVNFTPECRPIESTILPPAPPSLPTGNCPEGEFSCDGGCKHQELYCNFHRDCQDGVDEAVCPTVCDFEDGECGWTNLADESTQDWLRVNLRAQMFTEASTGHVMLARGDSSNPDRQRSVFASPLFSQAGSSCEFSFRYNSITYLRGSTVKLRAGGFDTVLWSLPARWSPPYFESIENNKWYHQYVAIPPCASNFRLLFEYDMSYTNQAELLILDDFRFENCGVEVAGEEEVCPFEQFRCSNGQCVHYDKVCDLQNDCCDGSDEDYNTCSQFKQFSFEHGSLDSWRNLVGDTHDWELQRGSLDYFTILDRDSHSQYGTYLAAKTTQLTDLSSNATASLVFEMPPVVEKCEIRFWYISDGEQSGNIRVYYKTQHSDKRLLDTILNPRFLEWAKSTVNIHIQEPYELIIEADQTKDSNDLGGIYLDDISLTPGCGLKQLVPESQDGNNAEVDEDTSRIRTDDSDEGLTDGQLALAVGVPTLVVGLVIIGALVWRKNRREGLKPLKFIE